MAAKKTPAKKAAKPRAKHPVGSPRHPVVLQYWEESERGWGTRPDGFSLHLTEADRIAFCKAYWAEEHRRNPGSEAPNEYSREAGFPKVVDVGTKTYNQLKKAKLGMRYYGSLSEL